MLGRGGTEDDPKVLDEWHDEFEKRRDLGQGLGAEVGGGVDEGGGNDDDDDIVVVAWGLLDGRSTGGSACSL